MSSAKYYKKTEKFVVHTEAIIALRSLSKRTEPYWAASEVPKNRQPIEQTESRRDPLAEVGRKVGPWRIGNIVFTRLKYICTHIF